jgi:hypothetical protein
MGFYMSLYSVDAESADQLVMAPGRADDTLQRAVHRVTGVDPDPQLWCYFDKAWHALHWLLARVYGHPLTFLRSGGRVLTDTRYAIRLHNPNEVGAIQAALTLVPDDELRMAYDANALTRAGVYPDIIWQRDGDVAREYVLTQVPKIRVLLAAACASHRHIAVVGGFVDAAESARLCTRILDTELMSEEEAEWLQHLAEQEAEWLQQLTEQEAEGAQRQSECEAKW